MSNDDGPNGPIDGTIPLHGPRPGRRPGVRLGAGLDAYEWRARWSSLSDALLACATDEQLETAEKALRLQLGEALLNDRPPARSQLHPGVLGR